MVERLSTIIIAAWLSELDSLKQRCDKAISQLTDDQLHTRVHPRINPITVIMRHMAGSMMSRFTDFLTTDGEKSTRNRDDEFREFREPREQGLQRWNQAWALVRSAIISLAEDDLDRSVTIRAEHHSVPKAIERAISHYAYHTGQILMLARLAAGDKWEWVTIAPGQSAAFNAEMNNQHQPPQT